ncbi:MAG: fibrobacter succinogenes major paralogous domain-containing protein [Bacteroidetes bacterium]|nr:fibrobacter succinogenes major paralogous domain-containing protein [Bacteroidota bacterium]
MAKPRYLSRVVLFFLVISIGTAFTQVPQSFNYQSIIHDASGSEVVNQEVNIRISLLQDSISGSAVYIEEHSAATNSLGLVTLGIGEGNVLFGNFAAINWETDSYYIKTELDATCGNNYLLMGTSRINSVPYALYAEKSGNTSSPLPAGNSPGEMIYWNGSNWVLIPPGSYGQQLMYCINAPSWRGCTIQVTDFDGNLYNGIFAGTQVWMTENLRVTHYKNGESIPIVTDDLVWSNLSSGAFCDYNNLPDNGINYGKLYNYFSVSDPRGLCPTGWHVPSESEFTTLIMFLGGPNVSGGKIKTTGALEAGTGLWHAPNTGATNESGLSALPGGLRNNDGSFSDLGYQGAWWSSTTHDPGTAWLEILTYNINDMMVHDDNLKSGFSVRCVRDSL